MFARVVDALFGCWHHRYSFPITIKKGPRSRAAFATGTYVVCLDCGQEFGYNWSEMRIGEPVGVPLTREAALSPAHR